MLENFPDVDADVDDDVDEFTSDVASLPDVGRWQLTLLSLALSLCLCQQQLVSWCTEPYSSPTPTLAAHVTSTLKPLSKVRALSKPLRLSGQKPLTTSSQT